MGADRVDMVGVFAGAREGDPPAVGRVVGVVVLRIVVGKLNPILSVDVHRVDLAVVSVPPARIDDLLAVGRVRRFFILGIVVGDVGDSELASPTDVYRGDP